MDGVRKKRRVVILAEAGSGKSSEFRGQGAALRAEGKFAFNVSVAAVAKYGLEGALPPKDRPEFAEWKAEPDAECWIFVDSVDEAKDQGHRFEDTVRNLEAAIAGRETRVYLYVSGRFTDWDKTADKELMETWLSLPQAPPPILDLKEEISATLQNREPPKSEPIEEISVLLLEPLTASQVRCYAEGAGLGDVDALLGAIEQGNLWSFARRPLDLEWMVGFWVSHKRLGTLREMIEESIKARRLDPDRERRKADTLEGEAAERALDRIGAGFLFCDKDTVRVPGTGSELTPEEKSLPLEALLPEWSDRNRELLLSRPVFDPATLDRARLHNDNEGSLRAYLAARWLEGRLEQNCPLQTVFDILFADVYGHRLVRPNMQESAAWLAGKVPAVAEELIRRSPFNLLVDGDPGSLPVATRAKAFEAAIEQVNTINKQRLWFIEEPLRRFAHPGLDPFLPGWWDKARDNEEARHLVLRLIHLGRQTGGLDIARAVAVDRTVDDISQLLAGRALVALGIDADRASYAAHILTHHTELKRSIVLQALDLLFPAHLSVDQFFALIDAVGITDSDGHNSILPVGPDLPEGLACPGDLQRFLEEIVARSGELTGTGEDHPFRDAFSSLAAAAAVRLLDTYPDEVPDVVTNLTMLLHESRAYAGFNDNWRLLARAFNTSPGRRRSSFWRAVERVRAHPLVPGSDDPNIWLVQHMGWPVGVDASDIDWLIEDVRDRTDPRDQLTALRAAHSLWRQFSNDDALLARLQAAAEGAPDLAAKLALWLSPQPDSPEIIAMTERHKVLSRENEERAAERDKSWITLIEELREDPSVFDQLTPQTEKSVDSRLFHLWQFLSWRTKSRSRHSITSLDSVEPIFGTELTRRFRDALIAFAYAHGPSLEVETGSQQRSVSNFDIMALAGMSLAAATIPRWAETIDSDRADQAARLAVIELNGFPDYLVPLAKTHPDAVRAVLCKGMLGQLEQADPQAHGMLDRLEYADAVLAELIGADLVAYLETHAEIPAPMLEKIVSVLLRITPLAFPGLDALAKMRVASAGDPDVAAYYLVILFVLEGDTAVDAMRVKMATLDPAGQARLCYTVLPRLFGDRFHRTATPTPPLSVSRMAELLSLAYEGVRPDEDIRRPSGEVYSPELRDEAQDARNFIFDRIANMPGEATYAALMRLAAIPDFPIRPDVVESVALQQAERDAALTAWQPEDVVAFELEFDRPPRTTADLQSLARRRLEGIEHDLLHGRFAQGDTLQGLVDENSVQRWVADQFEARQANAYTVQRETHHAEEKEPDISLTSRHSGVELPIEIKIVDGMTVPDMEAALETQLCAQYLRHASMRHGILLLIYQKARARGWSLRPGEPLVPFPQVLAHLQALATRIRESSALGPQPIVVAIDVSAVIPLQKKREDARIETARKKPGSGKPKGSGAAGKAKPQ